MLSTLTYHSSENLVKIASKHQPHSSIVAENLALPHPNAVFDFAISIAVIHHLSTPARRVQALGAILDLLRLPSSAIVGGGEALIFVWALEQKSSRRGWDEYDEQDVMVPWVMKQKTNGSEAAPSNTFHRYYHLYRRGELEHDVADAGGVVVESGYEKDNWWAIIKRQPSVVP